MPPPEIVWRLMRESFAALLSTFAVAEEWGEKVLGSARDFLLQSF
jgi:hypothetical protein